MKVYLDQIPPAGLELNQECPPDTLDLNRDDIRFSEPVRLSAQVLKEANTILVKLEVAATMHLTCSRCLEEFTFPFTKISTFNLPILGEENVIDILDNVREEIILAYPLRPLCRDDCRGLCPACGQNLNKGTCKCNN